MKAVYIWYLGVFLVSYSGFMMLLYHHHREASLRMISHAGTPVMHSSTSSVAAPATVTRMMGVSSTSSSAATSVRVTGNIESVSAGHWADMQAAKTTADRIEQAISDPVVEKRRIAIMDLARHAPSPDALTALSDVVRSDASAINRSRAIIAMSRLYSRYGDDGGEIRASITYASQDPDPNVAATAKSALQQMQSALDGTGS